MTPSWEIRQPTPSRGFLAKQNNTGSFNPPRLTPLQTRPLRTCQPQPPPHLPISYVDWFSALLMWMRGIHLNGSSDWSPVTERGLKSVLGIQRRPCWKTVLIFIMSNDGPTKGKQRQQSPHCDGWQVYCVLSHWLWGGRSGSRLRGNGIVSPSPTPQDRLWGPTYTPIPRIRGDKPVGACGWPTISTQRKAPLPHTSSWYAAYAQTCNFAVYTLMKPYIRLGIHDTST
jgi:hypothetical protein